MTYDLLFSSIEKHVPITEKDKGFLESIFSLRKVKKGKYLVHEGGVCRNQIFIVEGSIITYFIDINGHEHIIQLGIEGWWIGDFRSYVLQQPATFNVQATEDSSVLEASYENIQKCYEVIPQFERYHRILTQHAYIAFQQRMLESLSMPAEERYIAFTKKYPRIELRLPQKLIASYLGMTPEFLSKVKKKANAKRS